MICRNITVEGEHLYFAGRDTVELAQKYGTPLYLMDEQRLRENCRMYRQAMAAQFARGLPLFASKALSCKRVYQIVAEEGLGTDVVSGGELYMARLADFPMERIYFHGSSKTDEEIRYGLRCGVGCFVVDNFDELRRLDELAEEAGLRQKILLRLTPGIDPHTFEAVATGRVDSKFGVAIETGQAEQFVREALSLAHLELLGYHTHVGSQVFDSQVFYDAADCMLEFMVQMRARLGYTASVLNLGGGYGVRYVEEDGFVDIAGEIGNVAAYLKRLCRREDYPEPMVLLEPGRSIVADAGMTLYTVQSVKRIPDYKNYVCVDGGMTDNPRYALYGSSYTVLPAERMGEERSDVYTVGGRCCESGDVVQERVPLPEPKRGDLLAVLTTGAYNHSMASNYNNTPRPPMVMLNGAEDTLAIRRETWEDIARREV